MDSYAFYTATTCILCGLICSLLGVWLVSMRLSMLGDAISHAVLPGLALVFILFYTRASLPMLLGATFMGVVTVWWMRILKDYLRVQSDASMGIVFTTLFAIGVILITRYASQVDLDPGCVLYGSAELVALDTINFLGYEIPRTWGVILPTLGIVGVCLLLFHHRFLIMAFDAPLAKALNIYPVFYYYLLMCLVALSVVSSFESVGSILVIAMLTGPAASARLLFSNFRDLYIFSSVFSVIASSFGCWLGFWWNTSIAGCISIAVGIQFLIAAVVYLFKRSKEVEKVAAGNV